MADGATVTTPAVAEAASLLEKIVADGFEEGQPLTAQSEKAAQ